MRVLALIPARKGSKGLPNKNITMFCGKPLLKHTLDAALDSCVCHEVVLSTDYEKKDIEWLLPEGVTYDRRPDSLCTDKAKLDKTLTYIAKKYDFDVLILLQPTSPLRDSEDISEAFKKFVKTKVDSLISVCRQHQFIWIDKAARADGRDIPIGLYNPEKRPNRQEKCDVYRENGAIYITTRNGILQTGCRINGIVGLYEMEEKKGLEIDTPEDMKIGEILHG